MPRPFLKAARTALAVRLQCSTTGRRALDRLRMARQSLEATGSSSDGSVSGVLLGSEQLTVQIAPGTQDRLDAYAFAAAASEAATRMLADHLAKAMQVKLDVYLPEQLR